MGPWLTGVVLGYTFYKLKNRKISINKVRETFQRILNYFNKFFAVFELFFVDRLSLHNCRNSVSPSTFKFRRLSRNKSCTCTVLCHAEKLLGNRNRLDYFLMRNRRRWHHKEILGISLMATFWKNFSKFLSHS